ncbi:MAG: metal-dependent hydrolase [Patescibacteria group bacterium]|nr:metal-dependent hydrolase [Patescibacteria group bacterium]
MILPGHLATGFLATTAILSVIHPEFSSAQTNFLLIFGTLAGDFPDIDVLYHFLKKKSINPENLGDHRHYVTHAPILWFILGIIIFLVGSNLFLKIIGLLTLVGPTVHFLCDSIDYGVMWLWPFSNRRFSIIPWREPTNLLSRSPWGRLFEKYKKVPTFYVEIVVVIIAIVLLLQ